MTEIAEWIGMALVLTTLIFYNKGWLVAGAYVQLLSTFPWTYVALFAAPEPLWGMLATQASIAGIAGYYTGKNQ